MSRPKKEFLGSNIDVALLQKELAEIKESEKKYREAYEWALFSKDLIIHDFNNIFSVFLMVLSKYSDDLDAIEKLRAMKDIILIIKEGVRKGQSLISSIEKIFLIEEGISSIIEPIELLPILKEAIKYTCESFKEKQIHIKVDPPEEKIFVRANNFLLDVFVNILSNGVKYNKNSRAEIIIRISKKQKEEKTYAKIEFIDNGFGIPDAQKKRIFLRGHRIDNGIKGMGIGLAIVDKIVKSYDGQVWIEDKIKNDHLQGSNFIVLIPEFGS